MQPILDILNKQCENSGLSCYSSEFMKAAAGPTVVIGGALAATTYVLHRWSWNKDIREHCQGIMYRQQVFNIMLLTGGALTSVIAMFKLAAVGMSVAATATVFGGIWLSVGVCVCLNNLLHNRLVEQNAMKTV